MEGQSYALNVVLFNNQNDRINTTMLNVLNCYSPFYLKKKFNFQHKMKRRNTKLFAISVMFRNFYKTLRNSYSSTHELSYWMKDCQQLTFHWKLSKKRYSLSARNSSDMKLKRFLWNQKDAIGLFVWQTQKCFVETERFGRLIVLNNQIIQLPFVFKIPFA